MIDRPPKFTYRKTIHSTVIIRQRSKRRANFVVWIKTGKNTIRRFQKPNKAPPVVSPTKSSNVIDLSNYRTKSSAAGIVEEPNTCIKCDVFLPGCRHSEVFCFAEVPVVGSEIILEDISDRYVLHSVTHMATKPGSVFKPIVQLYLGALPKKTR
jgi:hypothetical protein